MFGPFDLLGDSQGFLSQQAARQMSIAVELQRQQNIATAHAAYLARLPIYEAPTSIPKVKRTNA